MSQSVNSKNFSKGEMMRDIGTMGMPTRKLQITFPLWPATAQGDILHTRSAEKSLTPCLIVVSMQAFVTNKFNYFGVL